MYEVGQKVTHCTVGQRRVGLVGTSFIRFHHSLSLMGQNDTHIGKTVEIKMNSAGFYAPSVRHITISSNSRIMLKTHNYI